MKLILCQLYPEHLSIYADRGNVRVIEQRCAWRGIDVELKPLRIGEDLDHGDAIVVLGAASVEARRLYILGGARVNRADDHEEQDRNRGGARRTCSFHLVRDEKCRTKQAS